MGANTGLSEERVRVVCHLPYRDAPNYRQAFDEIIQYIRQQRSRSVPVTGYTRSSLRPRVFVGYWWGVPDAKRNQRDAKPEWVPDEIVVLMIDLTTNLQDDRLSKFLRRLKVRILKIYATHRCKQQEIWIITHDSFRT